MGILRMVLVFLRALFASRAALAAENMMRPSMRNARVSRRNLRSGFLRGSGSTFYQRLNRPNMASEAAAAYSPGVGSTAQMVA
jgi:hypothetical protein